MATTSGRAIEAHRSPSGNVILLGDKDWSARDPVLIREAMCGMARAAAGEILTRDHVEAAIAREHNRDRNLDETEWKRIVALYSTLERIAPSPIHALNLALAETHLDDRLACLARRRVRASLQGGGLVSADRARSQALALGPARDDQELILRRLA